MELSGTARRAVYWTLDRARGGHVAEAVSDINALLDAPQLLTYLTHRAERVVSNQEILEHVWDQAFDAVPNVVEVYVGRLRRKLEPTPGISIDTVRGLGYRLTARRQPSWGRTR
ncbi:helix-turn-helix domain-containing protein [Georgenia daeguensis]|uniref:OmpR/PhoB-type domain-containing protein n=1 Tax=Georgenia daeguensis TaxID=908355 RepID=A0ABP8EYN8_9MICO